MKSLSGIALAIPVLVYSAHAHASAATVYVAQAQAGTGDGSSCANAKAVTFFNTAGNWGATATDIGPGTTVHLCGTLTTALKVNGSGTAGTPITMQWETGASVQVCSTTGAVQVNNTSYLVMDLGNSATAIECPNNGTGLATQTIAVGIGNGSLSHSEVRNGTIGPIFQYSGTANQGVGSYSVTIASGGGNHFHHLTLKDANQGFYVPLGGTVTGDEFNNMTVSNVGQGIWYALGNDGNVTDAKIHDWDVTYGINWAVPGDFTHTEVVHIFTQDAANNNIAVDIYNMYVHGSRPTVGYTADLFIDGSTAANHGTIKSNIYNNLLVSSANSFPGDGAIFVAGTGNTIGIYNNTVDCGSKTVAGIGSEFETASSTYAYDNNVFLNCQTPMYNQGTVAAFTADNNIYYNVGGWYWNSTMHSTLAQWQTASGQDATASTSDPGLNADYTPATATSLANTLPGKNLTSLDIAGLDAAKPLTVGVSGNGTANARPATGGWTAGAYQYCSGSSCNVVMTEGDGGEPSGDGGLLTDGSVANGEDASVPGGDDSGLPGHPTPAPSHGCSCEIGSASSPFSLALLLGVVGAIALAARPREKRHA
jgi:hypothetical protein